MGDFYNTETLGEAEKMGDENKSACYLMNCGDKIIYIIREHWETATKKYCWWIASRKFTFGALEGDKKKEKKKWWDLEYVWFVKISDLLKLAY